MERESESVLRHNSMVDMGLVARYEKLERELNRLGVETKMGADYNLTPPLGGSRLLRFKG